MARKNTTRKKGVNSKKSNRGLTTQITNQLRQKYVLVFVVLFALVGVYALLRSDASPALPTYSDDIVAGYINMEPTLISQDKNGNKAFELYSESVYVQADGTIVCDTGGTSNTVNTGVLSRGEVKKLQKDIYATGLNELADEIGFGSNDAFVSFEGMMVAGGSEAKGTAVYPGANKPTAFTKAQDTLTRLCAKATRKTERTTVKSPREPKLQKTNNKKSAFNFVSDSLFPKAAACCSAGTRDTAFEDQHAATINAHRRNNGRAQLAHTQCMRDKAVFWSDKMAKDGRISHAPSQNIMNDTAACHGNWRMAGENVGVGYDNTGLFNAFRNSATHNQNMLGNWKTFGVGAVRASKDNRIYVTQRYALY